MQKPTFESIKKAQEKLKNSMSDEILKIIDPSLYEYRQEQRRQNIERAKRHWTTLNRRKK